MAMFDFFKRKDKVIFEINNSSLREKLDKGVLFEGNNKFLKWGTAIKELSKEVDVKEKFFADRTVYNWGEHTILNGLTLPLTTTYWNHREDSIYKILKSINFSVTGNDEAQKYFALIKLQLESEFGQTNDKEISDTQVILEWVVNDTRLYLHFFEQYTNKLNFEISRL